MLALATVPARVAAAACARAGSGPGRADRERGRTVRIAVRAEARRVELVARPAAQTLVDRLDRDAAAAGRRGDALRGAVDRGLALAGLAGRGGTVLDTLPATTAKLLLVARALVHELEAQQRTLEQTVAERTERLRTQTQYLRALIDHFPFSVWLKDTSGRYLATNPANAQKEGLRLDDLIGRTDRDILPADTAAMRERTDREVMSSRASLTWQRRLPGEDGAWIENYKAPVLDEDGNVIGTMGYTRDITAQKTSERAREAAEIVKGGEPVCIVTSGAIGLAFMTGFLIVGPFLLMGLYDIARSHERGKPVSLPATMIAWRSDPAPESLVDVTVTVLGAAETGAPVSTANPSTSAAAIPAWASTEPSAEPALVY